MSAKPGREKTLSSTYCELQRYEQNGDYDRAVKAANKILHLAPQEVKAFHCKVVCLIQQSKFDDALQLILKNPTLSANLHFEKAYCQYRQNKPEAALKTVEEAEDDFRILELKAQILYRLENFEAAVKVYREIIKNTHDDYSDERETNLGAVIAQLGENALQEEDLNLRSNTYELSYNATCLLIAQGQYAEAEKKLRQCEKMCRESLDDDGSSDEEIDVELALIRIQLGYVFHKLGRVKEAQQLYAASLKLKLDDVALVAVANNNLVVINKDQNVFDSKKKMKNAMSDVLIHKLPSRQRKFIALNNAIFMYYSNQNEQCARICAIIEKNWPELRIYAKVITALCLERNTAGKGLDLLKNFETNQSDDQLFVQLACVNLLLMQGKQLEACKALESLGEDSYRPGIVGALITLYLGMGKEDTALKVFEKTVDWYRQSKMKEGDLSIMWRQAADFHMRNGHPNVAANSLEELLKTNPEDKKTIAQLVLAYAQFDKNKAMKLSEKLPVVESFSEDVDIESLDTATWVATKKSVVKVESLPGTPKSDTSLTKKKKNRKKKGKLPKDYDPERWLPKYERTGFRKKRDRRIKEVIKGSQGTTSAQGDQFDFSNVANQEALDSPVSSVEPSPAPRTQHKKQQKKKNKRR